MTPPRDDPPTRRIRLNGRDQEVRAATVADLLAALERDGRGVAVARNGALVPRAAWAATALVAGDAIEIVTAKQGG